MRRSKPWWVCRSSRWFDVTEHFWWNIQRNFGPQDQNEIRGWNIKTILCPFFMVWHSSMYSLYFIRTPGPPFFGGERRIPLVDGGGIRQYHVRKSTTRHCTGLVGFRADHRDRSITASTVMMCLSDFKAASHRSSLLTKRYIFDELSDLSGCNVGPA